MHPGATHDQARLHAPKADADTVRMNRYRGDLLVSALQIAVRVGVVACVAAACLLGAGRLDDTVAVFDYRSDTNAAATFNERTYPEIDFLPKWDRVLEDARLWMPENANYVVLDGPNTPPRRSGPLRTFLLVLLTPRQQTRVSAAPWAFCFDCTPSMLRDYEVLSDSGHGFLFARRRS